MIEQAPDAANTFAGAHGRGVDLAKHIEGLRCTSGSGRLRSRSPACEKVAIAPSGWFSSWAMPLAISASAEIRAISIN